MEMSRNAGAVKTGTLEKSPGSHKNPYDFEMDREGQWMRLQPRCPDRPIDVGVLIAPFRQLDGL